MEFVVFIGVVVLLAFARHAASRVGAWWRRVSSGEGGRLLPTADPTGVTVVYPVVEVDGEREESVLVAGLLAGDLPPARYRARMAELARQDTLRAPVVVPLDGSW